MYFIKSLNLRGGGGDDNFKTDDMTTISTDEEKHPNMILMKSNH